MLVRHDMRFSNNERSMSIYRFYILQIFGFVCLLIGLTSCKEKSHVEDIDFLMSKPVYVNTDSMLLVLPIHNSSDENYIKQSNDFEYSLVAFTDSTVCNPCAAKVLYQWNNLIDTLNVRYRNKINTYFIFDPQNDQQQELIYAMEEGVTEFPVYIDTLHSFRKANTHIPASTLMHIFLIDRNGNVLLVGSPLKSEKIRNLMFQLLDNKR